MLFVMRIKEQLNLVQWHIISFENTVGKGEIAHYEQFLLFSQCFLPVLDNFLPFSSNLNMSSANSFSLEESKIVVWERVNSGPSDLGTKVLQKY